MGSFIWYLTSPVWPYSTSTIFRTILSNPRLQYCNTFLLTTWVGKRAEASSKAPLFSSYLVLSLLQVGGSFSAKQSLITVIGVTRSLSDSPSQMTTPVTFRSISVISRICWLRSGISSWLIHRASIQMIRDLALHRRRRRASARLSVSGISTPAHMAEDCCVVDPQT